MSVPAAENRSNCLVCDVEVEYLDQAINGRCYYCETEEQTYFLCRNGHYICNKCHSKEALAVIGDVCLSTNEDNPFIIAEKIMEHPAVHMHGPEHHALVPAVLVAAYKNHRGLRKEKAVREAIKRGRTVPGGYCGLYGACGAGVGVGIAVSVLLGATPLTPEERSHANLATSRALNSIARSGGARCCKKTTRISLEEGMRYLSGLLELEWEMPEISGTCNYMIYNRECDVNCRFRKKN
ncbi:radical SAM protein [Methanolobus halotolerans]|uniref:Radical SAM protein n=1 Tax=Methanolobus halotolerans TaxID=2052935 RepID=A0A4E0PWG0_9EURY|nr:radical SAM protein [Methanolobus halotolerans]